MDNSNDTYYIIYLSYEIFSDVLNCPDEDISNARNILYDRLSTSIPRDKYDIFNSSIVTYQLPDNYNYLVTYSSYIRSVEGLPMEEYVAARDIRDTVKRELEDFFESINCEYKSLNIKALV
jgi:hypothetical protein